MKSIKNLQLKSTLLVPMPEALKEGNLAWIGTINGSSSDGVTSNTVDIIAFNTTEKDGIKPLLEKILTELEAVECPNNVEENNITFVKKTLGEIGVTGIEHDAPEGLLEALAVLSRSKKLTKQEVIYLSGVASIREE